MFEKEKSSSGSGTIVGTNVKLTGTLKDSNDITVHGQVDGEVISEKNITITQTATIKGPVVAQMVIIAGSVNGSVNAREKLEILSTGDVKGSIETKELVIKSGAQFNGKSTMQKGEKELKNFEVSQSAEPKSKKTELLETKTTAKKPQKKNSPDKDYELE